MRYLNLNFVSGWNFFHKVRLKITYKNIPIDLNSFIKYELSLKET